MSSKMYLKKVTIAISLTLVAFMMTSCGSPVSAITSTLPTNSGSSTNTSASNSTAPDNSTTPSITFSYQGDNNYQPVNDVYSIGRIEVKTNGFDINNMTEASLTATYNTPREWVKIREGLITKDDSWASRSTLLDYQRYGGGDLLVVTKLPERYRFGVAYVYPESAKSLETAVKNFELPNEEIKLFIIFPIYDQNAEFPTIIGACKMGNIKTSVKKDTIRFYDNETLFLNYMEKTEYIDEAYFELCMPYQNSK